jgi:eukaryotic-like serine/threonine-protein kinase
LTVILDNLPFRLESDVNEVFWMASTSPDSFPTGVASSSGSPSQETTAASPPGGLLLQDNQAFGDYRIIRLLGRGGMGEVYEADDCVNGRRVALKVVNVARNSPVALRRFLREGQLAASLSHPNTVYVFASGEIAGIPYIVTEFVTGGTLADRVEASG